MCKAEIARRNDECRARIPFILKPNLFVQTRGIADLSPQDQLGIWQEIRQFNTFNADNDPWGEHDFGSFDFKGQKIFWKIDDYNGTDNLELVLTIMLAEEY